MTEDIIFLSLLPTVLHLGLNCRVLSEELHVCQVPEFIRGLLRLLLPLSTHFICLVAQPSKHPRILYNITDESEQVLLYSTAIGEGSVNIGIPFNYCYQVGKVVN